MDTKNIAKEIYLGLLDGIRLAKPPKKINSKGKKK
jgi:hypothetical protein